MCSNCVAKGYLTQAELDEQQANGGLGEPLPEGVESFLGALMSGKIKGYEALIEQAEKDHAAEVQAGVDKAIAMMVEGARGRSDSSLSEHDAAEELAGQLMFIMDAKQIAYLAALFSVRQARAEDAAEGQGSAPVSAADLFQRDQETERADADELIDAALKDELDGERAEKSPRDVARESLPRGGNLNNLGNYRPGTR